MDMQNVSNLTIPEGEVKAIHNSSNQLLWGRANYNTKYAGDTFQQTYSGKNLAYIGWAQDFVARIGTTVDAKLETVDGRSCVWWKANAGYGSYDTKYIFKTDFKENTQYTVSFDIKPSATFSNICFEYTDGTTSGNLAGLTANTWQHITMTSTAGKTLKNLHAYYQSGGVYVDINTFIVELGSTATTYEPYVGGIPSPNPDYPQDIKVVTGTQVVSITDGTNTQNFTVDLGSIELCKIGTYQDYIYKSGDDWYVHKEFAKLELDGSEDWVVANTTASRYPFGIDVSGVRDELKGAAISDTYIYDTVSGETTVADANKFTFRGRWAGDRFYFMTPKVAVSGSTAEEIVNSFKTFLSGHPTKVYFTPTTATDTKITDATLISQLNAVHQWMTRYGYNATVSGNLPLIVDRTNL